MSAVTPAQTENGAPSGGTAETTGTIETVVPATEPAPGESVDHRPTVGTPAYVWLFLAGIVATMFSGNSQYLHMPISPDRPLLLLSLVLLVLDKRTELPRWNPVWPVMIATVLWTLWSWSSTGSLADTYKAFGLLDRIVMPFLMFLVGPFIFSDERRRDLLLKTLVVVGIYLGITGIFEIVHLNALIWPKYINDPDIGIGYGRARGPFAASEPLGMVCNLSFFASGILITRSTGRWRATAYVALVLTAIGSVLSLTRTDWISFAVGAVIAGLLVPRLRRWVPVAVIGAVVLFGLLLAVSPDLQSLLSDRLGTERSIYDRLNTNAAALRIIEAHPLDGIGWLRFVDVNVDWVRQADTYPVTTVTIEVHNVFLSRAAETGLLGAVLWGLSVLVGPAAVLFLRGRTREMQAWRLFTLLALLVWLLPSVSSPNPYPMPNYLIWLIAGVAGRELIVRSAARRRRVPVTKT